MAATLVPCGDLHLADLAIEGRAQGQRIHLALQLGHHRALAVGQQALVARVQSGALALQSGILAARAARPISAFFSSSWALAYVDLRHRAAFEGALVALQVALRGGALDPRLVQRSCRARGARDLRVQDARGWPRLPCWPGVEPFLGELAAQFGAVDLGQRLALLDHVAGHDLSATVPPAMA